MLVPNIRETIARTRELPTLPAVLGQILSTVSDPDASALDLGRHIAADQSLSATLLKLVNSAYYGFYRQITSVTMAIVILGFVEVRNLVLAATAFRAFSGGRGNYDRAQLWRHTLAAAIAAERCSKVLHLDSNEGFVCGLLHDIGKVTLDTLYPEQFDAAAQQAHLQERHIRHVEEEVFGIDHGEVGGLLAENWNLPVAVVESIRFHHAPLEAEINLELTCLTSVANYIAYEAGFGESSNGCPPEIPEAACAKLGLSESERAAVIEDIERNRDRIESILGAL